MHFSETGPVLSELRSKCKEACIKEKKVMTPIWEAQGLIKDLQFRICL